MAAPGPWTLYNEFKSNIGKKLIDLVNDAFKVALVLSTSNAINAALATATYANITNEVANGNGYTTAGASAASPTWTGTSTLTFDTADVSWTASGGSIVARAAVLYDNTTSPKYLIAYALLDSTPADVTVASGNTLTVQVTNVFTLT